MCIRPFTLTFLGAIAMKKMIRMAMMAAVMFVAVASVSKAQDAAQQGGRRGGGRGGVGMLLRGIEGVDTAKVNAIAAKYGPDMMAARQAGDTAKAAELRKKEFDEIKALLTPEQQKQFDENVANMGRGRRGGGR